MAIPVLGRSPDALPALLYFVTAYAVAQLAALGVVTELRGRTDLDDYRGLAAQHPWLATALTLSFLSFVGIPPLAGFGGKLLLFTADHRRRLRLARRRSPSPTPSSRSTTTCV